MRPIERCVCHSPDRNGTHSWFRIPVLEPRARRSASYRNVQIILRDWRRAKVCTNNWNRFITLGDISYVLRRASVSNNFSKCSVAEHWPRSCFMRRRDYLSNIQQAHENRQASDSSHRDHVLHFLGDLHVAPYVVRNFVAISAASATVHWRERFADERVGNAWSDTTIHGNRDQHDESFRHLECEWYYRR